MSELGPDIIEEARLRYIAAVESGEIDPTDDIPDHLGVGDEVVGFTGYLFEPEDLDDGELTEEIAEALLERHLAELALEKPEAFAREDGMCPSCGGQHAEFN